MVGFRKKGENIMPAKYHKGIEKAWGRSPVYTDQESVAKQVEKESMLREQMHRVIKKTEKKSGKKRKKKKWPWEDTPYVASHRKLKLRDATQMCL